MGEYIEKLLEGKDIYSNTNDMILKMLDLQMNSGYVFRGFSKEEELFPNILRQFIKVYDPKLKIDGELFKYETMLYRLYNQYSIQYLPYYENSMDWLASAQHFGLPTRLVDWTKDPLVALFFSINNLSEDDSYVIGTTICSEKKTNEWLEDYSSNPEIFKDNFAITEIPNLLLIDEYSHTRNRWVNILRNFRVLDVATDCKFDNYKEAFYESLTAEILFRIRENDLKHNRKSLIFLSANDSNPRIITQKGLFQIAQFPKNKCNSIEELKNHLVDEIRSNVKVIFKIDKHGKIELLKKLAKQNYFIPRLFPDLSSICTYLKNNVLPEGLKDE